MGSPSTPTACCGSQTDGNYSNEDGFAGQGNNQMLVGRPGDRRDPPLHGRPQGVRGHRHRLEPGPQDPFRRHPAPGREGQQPLPRRRRQRARARPLSRSRGKTAGRSAEGAVLQPVAPGAVGPEGGNRPPGSWTERPSVSPPSAPAGRQRGESGTADIRGSHDAGKLTNQKPAGTTAAPAPAGGAATGRRSPRGCRPRRRRRCRAGPEYRR